jgi:hypothetical protein
MKADLAHSAAAHDTARIVRRDAVLHVLRGGEKLQATSIFLRLLFGLLLSLLLPFLVAWSFQGIAYAAHWDDPPGWWTGFAVAVAVLVPLMMLLVRLMDRVDPHESVADYERRLQESSGTAPLHIFFVGPRLIWSAIDGLRGRSEVRHASESDACTLVEALYLAEKGQPLADLVDAVLPEHRLKAALRLLERFDLADQSADGKKVWLRSDFRRQLDQASGVEPEKPPAARR